MRGSAGQIQTETLPLVVPARSRPHWDAQRAALFWRRLLPRQSPNVQRLGGDGEAVYR